MPSIHGDKAEHAGQIRLTSSVESVRASLEPYREWIEQTIGVPLRDTLTLEVDCNPGDAVAEELLRGLPVASVTRARNSSWRALIEDWALPPGVSPRISASLQRERRPNAPPFPVWELDWQDCPVAFRMRGLSRHVNVRCRWDSVNRRPVEKRLWDSQPEIDSNQFLFRKFPANHVIIIHPCPQFPPLTASSFLPGQG